MAVVVFLQLIIRRHQCPAVLLHGPLLLGELLSQHGQLGFRACDGLLIVLYSSSSQTEGGLGFLDLLVDGAHIAREIAGIQRQRDHQFAQGFSHKSSPTFPLWLWELRHMMCLGKYFSRIKRCNVSFLLTTNIMKAAFSTVGRRWSQRQTWIAYTVSTAVQ